MVTKEERVCGLKSLKLADCQCRLLPPMFILHDLKQSALCTHVNLVLLMFLKPCLSVGSVKINNLKENVSRANLLTNLLKSQPLSTGKLKILQPLSGGVIIT